MRYVSTRGGMEPAGFRDVLLEGLAPDGGLVVPSEWPTVAPATLARWGTLDYAGLAAEVLARFADPEDAPWLGELCRATYTAGRFGSAEVTPLATLEPGLHLLGLSNGPTLAFKDLAMQLLGALFEGELARRGEVLNVLGATSGDTGSAAEEALRGRAGIRVFMLSPWGRMSEFQRAQMYSVADANVFNIAVEGTFDDCQDIVKALGGDLAFKREHRLGAVNSINWARVCAQVVYYVRGYLAAAPRLGDEVDFCVPSGNFGNALAGWIARRIGVPIGRIAIATNENDVLDEFFRTARYRVRGAAQTLATSSPSMDISRASNFERFVFELLGRDPAALRALWSGPGAAAGFDLSGTPHAAALGRCGIVSGRSTHADRLATIRDQYARDGRILDPHTADGVKVARERRRPGVPMVALETALPAKFAATIREALGFDPPRPAAFLGLEARPQRFVRVPAEAGSVREILLQHAALPA